MIRVRNLGEETKAVSDDDEILAILGGEEDEMTDHKNFEVGSEIGW